MLIKTKTHITWAKSFLKLEFCKTNHNNKKLSIYRNFARLFVCQFVNIYNKRQNG